ncbi:substrate-binding domain-containing protein [Pontiella sp.]|uniref:substrate-binding domain-containing protein n=1 Tax=Pontiella sp. TaxID=2837462 RepID=UPI00356325C0
MKAPNNSPYKYKEICDDILARIKSGELSSGMRLPSARSLGEQYECNYHTARRAFEKLASQGYLELRHGSGTFVAETPGNRVRHDTESEKVIKSTDRIGVLLPLKQWGHYVTSLIDHLYHSAEKMNIKLNIRTVPSIGIESADIAHDFINQNCCSIILPWLGEDQNLSHLHSFVRASSLPVVLANPVPGLESNCYLDPEVDVDIYHTITYLQCRYFKKLGYKHIALLGPDTIGVDYWQRNIVLYTRWCDMENYPNLVGMVDRTPESYTRMIERWKPYAGDIGIIAYHDEIALEFMLACERNGISVPGDFGVLGHNNNPLGLRSNPPLSTVLCPFEYVSDGLLRHAIAQSKGSSAQLDGDEPKELFIRQSCGGRMKFGDKVDDIISDLLMQTREMETGVTSGLESDIIPFGKLAHTNFS